MVAGFIELGTYVWFEEQGIPVKQQYQYLKEEGATKAMTRGLSNRSSSSWSAQDVLRLRRNYRMVAPGAGRLSNVRETKPQGAIQ